MSKKYDVRPYRQHGFKFCVRSRLGDHLVAACNSKAMAEKIAAALMAQDNKEQV